MLLKCSYKLCDCRCFLSDCNIDTDNILALLVKDCIGCNTCFTGLAVTDYKLTLSASDREH